MKKMLSIIMAITPVILCGCNANYQNSQTRFMLDTVVSIDAAVQNSVLNGAFSLCTQYENLLSKTVQTSDIGRLNSDGTAEVGNDALTLIKESLRYSRMTDGKFDITVCSVTDLWDFENGIIPNGSNIAEQLKNVDYKKIAINGNTVELNGAKIDLGAIAKGYIADKVSAYLKENGAKSATVNMGGNIAVFGENYSNIGVKDPFGDGIAATLKVKNRSVVTSGTYERCFTKDGKNYHHIIDTKTGYPAATDIKSATVIGNDGTSADALSTCCILLGLQDGMQLIEKTENVEALFIYSNGGIHISSGIYCEDGVYRL